MKANQQDTPQNTIGRLRKQAAFDRLRGLRTAENRWTAKSLSLQICEAVTTDMGISVSRKTAKRAVDRNRIKRRLRVIARNVMAHHARKGQYYLITGRTDAMSRSMTELTDDLTWCLKKLRVYVE